MRTSSRHFAFTLSPSTMMKKKVNRPASRANMLMPAGGSAPPTGSGGGGVAAQLLTVASQPLIFCAGAAGAQRGR